MCGCGRVVVFLTGMRESFLLMMRLISIAGGRKKIR